MPHGEKNYTAIVLYATLAVGLFVMLVELVYVFMLKG